MSSTVISTGKDFKFFGVILFAKARNAHFSPFAFCAHN